jgi:hypothetical protein
MRGPNSNKSGYIRIKHSKMRDDKIRFGKIRQENKVRREEIRKKQASEMQNRRDKL